MLNHVCAGQEIFKAEIMESGIETTFEFQSADWRLLDFNDWAVRSDVTVALPWIAGLSLG